MFFSSSIRTYFRSQLHRLLFYNKLIITSLGLNAVTCSFPRSAIYLKYVS
ncbi:hypothetical protein N665_0052s0020 [Sinapis alba]|nr:hypothetical protein N665_0052s0020 [Sinapis alba]